MEMNIRLKKPKRNQKKRKEKEEDQRLKTKTRSHKNAPQKKDLTIEQIEELLKQKQEESVKKVGEEETLEELKEEEKEDETIYVVDGVSYEMNDDDVLDSEDFSIIGKKDGNGGIVFEDEDAEKKHRENIEKLSS